MTLKMNRIVLTMDVADWRDVPVSRDKRDLILRRLAKDVAHKIDKDAAGADIVVQYLLAARRMTMLYKCLEIFLHPGDLGVQLRERAAFLQEVIERSPQFCIRVVEPVLGDVQRDRISAIAQE